MHSKFLLSISFALALFIAPTLGYSADLCSSLFASEDHVSKSDPARRARIVHGDVRQISTGEWLNLLEDSGRLLFRGKHRALSGTEFVASNEGDWYNTPFDGVHADVLVGFGTNSAWELLANKTVNNFVLADWSPLPLFAHAYVMEPLMRISKTPVELMIHLGGFDPATSPPITIESASALLSNRFDMAPRQIEAFIQYLSARKEIRDNELEFLSFYYRSRDVRAKLMRMLGQDLSPFADLRGPSYSNFNLFFQLRYGQVPSRMQAFSVFHNQKLFDHVRGLYVGRRVEYALAGVNDLGLYQTVQQRHPSAKSWSLSVTNIFDMNYNGLSFANLQDLIANVVTAAGISQAKPLTVFRTTNFENPHGFHRYDVTGMIDVPQHDTADSKVGGGKPQRASGF